MPIILAAGFFRLRYETRAEEANQEVFRESAGFATESIGAVRTVTSLGLEGSIVSHPSLFPVVWTFIIGGREQVSCTRLLVRFE